MEIDFIRVFVKAVIIVIAVIIVVVCARMKQECFFEPWLWFREDIPAEVREKVKAEMMAEGVGIGGAWKWPKRIEELMEEYTEKQKEVI